MTETAIPVMEDHTTAALVADFGPEMRVVSEQDWQSIKDAVALIKGRLSEHVDPMLLARLGAVRVCSLTVEVSE